MDKRESGIDLLRCVALLFVVGVHSFLYNGFYYEDQVGALMWAADSARWLCYSCNCLFMMLTGYLKSTKSWSKGYYRSLVPILMGYLLCCAVSFPIRHFLLGEQLSFIEWLMKLVTFANYGWYVEMYIGLFLLSPFINIVLEKMKSPGQYAGFAGTMLFLTALPSITDFDIIPDYWVALYPITMYVLGAGIRRFRPNVPAWLAAVSALATVCGMGLVSLLCTDGDFGEGFSQGYGGFWVTLTGLSVFLAVYQVRLGKTLAPAVRWMAGGCFEGFLLSRLFDVWVYDAAPAAWREPDKYWLCFLAITLPVYFASIVLGNLVHAGAVKLSGILMQRKQPTQA